MIRGRMRSLEAVIELDVFGTADLPGRAECVIDTGFNGWMTLPSVTSASDN